MDEPSQEEEEDVSEILEEWKKLIDNKNELRKGDIQTIQQWMNHPKKERFIDWKDDSIGHGSTLLHCAIMYERLDIAKLLLQHGANIIIASKNGNTAMSLASWKGHAEIVEILLERGVDSNMADKNGTTALIWASIHGHTNIVELLLEKGASITIANKKGRTALMCASLFGHTGVAQLLLDKGADITIVENDGWTALTMASQGGNTDTVKLLLERGGDINIANKNGMTALMKASEKGHLKTVKLLLDKGADRNIFDKKGRTALSLASAGGHADTVKLLSAFMDDSQILEEWKKLVDQREIKNANIETITQWLEHPKKELFINWKNDSNFHGDTMLHCAIGYERWDIAKLLLKRGVDITIVNKSGNTALNHASWKGNTEMVKLLLEHGANPEIADNQGLTVLMTASDEGHTEVVELLLTKGADITRSDRDGNTALMLASRRGHTEVVQLLLDKGADITILDKDGWSALMHASRRGYTEIVKRLSNKGADITIANKDGNTALMWASDEGHTNLVELLLDKGADIANTNKYGETALMWASIEGHTKIVELLLDKGAECNVGDKNGMTALMKASDSGHTNTVKLLLDKGADCKLTNNQGRSVFENAYYQGHTDMVDLLLENAPLKDIIHDVVKYAHFADKFLELYQENRKIVNWLDEDGRTVRQVACKECREVVLFLGQYDLDGKPVYESPTCNIYNALDFGGPEENLAHPRLVVAKFFKEEEHFENEMGARRKYDGSPTFSSEFVTPHLAAYQADLHQEYAEACRTWKNNGSETTLLPGFCLVMERGERSLMDAMNNENLSAKHKDLERRDILQKLCRIFSYLHGVGYIHGDIKPHNVVRHTDPTVTWKAIDFDACTKIGDVAGLKLTTGSAPPEMLKIIKKEDLGTESLGESKVVLRQPGGGLDGSDLVLADPSFDVWSFGILMYQLVTGRSFFHSDLQGNVDGAGLQEMANLTQPDIHKKLDGVEDVNAKVILSRILRLDSKERPSMSDIGEDYYFHPSESPQGRKAEFFGKQVFGDLSEDHTSTFEANETSGAEKNDSSENMKEMERSLSSKAEFSYFKLRDEDKDWSDKLLNSEVETFCFDKLGQMGEKPKFIDGDTIYNSTFLRGLLSNKGPDYLMGFLVEYFELYKIMHDAHEVCQGIKANLVSDVKDLKGVFIKLFVRGKGLNDVVRGTLFCNSIDHFKDVGRQLKERCGHNVFIKPPKKEDGAWPIPKLLIYGNRRFQGCCMAVELQFSTVYMHLATHASNSHLVYEAIRESTGYLGERDKEFREFLRSLNEQHIDTEGFLQNRSAQEGRFEILAEKVDDNDSGETPRVESEQYITKATGFISSGWICCGDQKFQFMSPSDRFQRYSQTSFVVNNSLTLLSSHSYWSDESYDLEGKSVEFVVSFKERGLAIAGIGTAKCLHGSMESDGGGSRCSVHVGRSKFVVRKTGVEEVIREKKLPDQERSKISFKMKDGVLLVSFSGSGREDDEEIESAQASMPSDQRYYLYMRAPPGVHDSKFHEVGIRPTTMHKRHIERSIGDNWRSGRKKAKITNA